MDISEMLSADYLAAYQANPPPPVPFRGPLPDLVTHHYSSGGCFVLAIALHLASGWPLEVHCRAGVPRHAYVTDGQRALDVLGFRPIQAARAGADSSPRMEPNALVALLGRTSPNGKLIARDIHRRESRVAAEHTAAALIDAVGLPASDPNETSRG